MNIIKNALSLAKSIGNSPTNFAYFTKEFETKYKKLSEEEIEIARSEKLSKKFENLTGAHTRKGYDGFVSWNKHEADRAKEVIEVIKI